MRISEKRKQEEATKRREESGKIRQKSWGIQSQNQPW
jgi:hypothetical protein